MMFYAFSRLAAVSCLCAATLTAGAANAQNNPPPVGQVVFSLDGQPIPHTYTTYTVNFAATNATTNLAFAFREDPAYFSIDNITLTTGSGPNLVVNGDFSQGPLGASQPTGWSYLNLYNAPAAGRVAANCGVTGTGDNCYYDGAVGSYDTITQAIATTVGSVYTLSFALTDNSTQTTASALQVGNQAGINLVVYAGAANPTVPEPATWALMVVGFGAVGAALRRRHGATVRFV